MEGTVAAATNRQTAQINRDLAIADFFKKLTELAEVGRHFLQAAADAELKEQEEARQRRRERLSRQQR